MMVNMECPVELIEYKLYESTSTGKVYCSLTFNNVSFNKVKGLKAMIYGYDQFGDSIGDGNNSLECKIEFKEGLACNRQRKTDNKILLSGFQNIRKIEIDVIKVLFDDRSIWNKDTSESERFELTKIENTRLLEYVKSRAGSDANYFAEQYNDKWTCVCGRLNLDDQSTCTRCRRGRDDVLTKYSDEAKINNELKAIEAKQAERQRKEEKEREQQLVIAKQKSKKVTTYISVGIAIMLIVGVSVFGYMTKFTFSIADPQLLNEKDTTVVEAVKDDSFYEVNKSRKFNGYVYRIEM